MDLVPYDIVWVLLLGLPVVSFNKSTLELIKIAYNTVWRLCAGGGISGSATSCECLLTAWCAARCWQWADEERRPTNRAAYSWTQHCRWTNLPCLPRTESKGHEMVATRTRSMPLIILLSRITPESDPGG